MRRETKVYLFKAALYYYTCCLATEMSFKDLFESLAKYVNNEKQRFRLCIRSKRGLTDTGLSGGYYKDKVYFEGAVKILSLRKEIDIETLYAGKISIEDLKRKQFIG